MLRLSSELLRQLNSTLSPHQSNRQPSIQDLNRTISLIDLSARINESKLDVTQPEPENDIERQSFYVEKERVTLCCQLNILNKLSGICFEYLPKMLAQLKSPGAWAEIFTDASSSFRQFRALYAVIDAIFDATGSTNYGAFDYIFLGMFAAFITDLFLKTQYILRDRSEEKPSAVTTAVCFTEIVETMAATLTIGSIIQDPSGTGIVSLQNQWLLVAVSTLLGGSQFFSGIDGQINKGTGHSCIEAYGVPSDEPVTHAKRMLLCVLRLLHLSHILTLLYGLSDFLNTVFQNFTFFEYYHPLNAIYLALPFTIIYGLTTRGNLYSLWSDNLPFFAKRIMQVDSYLYVLNNLLLAFTASVYTIILIRLNIENQEGPEYIYNSLVQSLLTIYLPASIVALCVIPQSHKQYHQDIGNEIYLRDIHQDGSTEKQRTDNMQQCVDANRSSIADWYNQPEQAKNGAWDFFKKFSGELKMRSSERPKII